MKRAQFSGLVLIVGINLLWGGGLKDDTMTKGRSDSLAKIILAPSRDMGQLLRSEKDLLDRDLYEAVRRANYSPEDIKALLDAGADPNYCKGEFFWYDSNPLMVNIRKLFGTFYAGSKTGIKSDAAENVVSYFREARADFTRLPYIWVRVASFFKPLEISPSLIKAQFSLTTQEKIDEKYQEYISTYIEDANRLIRLYIEAGANPDMRGDPKPYEHKLLTAMFMTDKKAARYFAKGTRPINEAIKKGIVWESQVDLLLEYVKLDEDSLVAAKESNDPAMIAKINALWNKQQSEH
jgi:hypothetical protein